MYQNIHSILILLYLMLLIVMYFSFKLKFTEGVTLEFSFKKLWFPINCFGE